MSIFEGAATAMITPFKNGCVDFEALAKLIDFQIQNAIDALVVCGTTGEPATMSGEEKRAVIDFAIRHVGGRVPVIIGTGGNNTAAAIEASQAAADAGADALLVVTPYYNKCSQEGLLQHYTASAGATPLPLILYNVPSRTGVNIHPETLARLAEHSNIAAIKEASGDISQVTEMIRLCGDALDFYSGNDDQVIPMMALGGKGVISVTANIAPQAVGNMARAWLAGDVKEAARQRLHLNPLSASMFLDVNPIPVKKAAELMNLCSGELRLPLCALSKENTARLASILNDYALLEQLNFGRSNMKIIICGANGRMGQTLAGVIANHPDAECVAGVDLFPDAHTNTFPVFRHISDFTGDAEMIIDFSRPATLRDNLDYALAHQTPIVIATTGYSKKDRELIQQSARHIPVFFTANMSLGVNLQMDLCRQAAAFYGSAVDIEIIEKHHNQKVDAPSGTALALADTINSAYGGNLEYQFGRHGTNCKRTDSEIGIHAIRGGSIVGEHEVLFINDDEIIEITHRSRTRQVFATGAVRAAFFLANLPAGLYSMQDIVFETRTITNILVDDRQALISIDNVPHDIHII